ncbi:MAG: NifU family protein [bacterium]
MEQRIKTVLEREVKPILASHGGGCEFVKLTKDNIVMVKLTGMCCGCRGAKASIKGVVEGILKEKIEGIKGVEEA